jgi:uncharacterized membrane protein YjjP (DUF1212 family)
MKTTTPQEITLNEVNQVIAKFGPILRLHPAEKYLLDDPARALATSSAPDFTRVVLSILTSKVS